MLKPIKTSKQHKEYLNRAYELMQKDIKPDTIESDELEVISILIEQYEKDKHPIAPPRRLLKNPLNIFFKYIIKKQYI